MKFEPTLHKLSNGVTVLLDPMDIETVSMKIFIKGGSCIEKPSEYGISHFLEHMVFNGTNKYPTNKIMRDTLNDNGGTRGGATGVSYTHYNGRILAENFHVLLDVLSEMVLNPILKQSEMARECSVIIQEINRSRDDNARQFNNVVKSNMFSDSYLEKYDNLGTVDTVSSFTSEDLHKYMKEKYTANNIIIGISGKLGDTSDILDGLEQRFSHLKPSADISPELPVLHPKVVYDIRNDKKQTKLFIGFEGLYPDERKYDYEDMCVGVFESALVRRLTEDVREKQGLVYSFGLAGYGDRYCNANGFMTALSPEKLTDLIASVARGCYDILHRNPVTLEELKRKNTMIKLSRADFYESSGRRCDRLIGFYSDYGDLYNPAEFDILREKMTIEDVMKYSGNYFDRPISIIAQGPECDIDLKKVWDENFK